MWFYIPRVGVFLMFGAWFPNSEWLVFSLIRFLVVFLIVYFLAIVIYWFNRTGKIPSLRVAWRIMIQLARWFPKILIHRLKIFPARLRRKNVDAYPSLNIPSSRVRAASKKSSSKKKKNKK